MAYFNEVIIDTNQVDKIVDLVLADRAYYAADNVSSYDELAALRLESEIYQMINRLISNVDQRAVSKYGITVLKEVDEQHMKIDVLYNPTSWDVHYDSYYYDVERKQVIFN